MELLMADSRGTPHCDECGRKANVVVLGTREEYRPGTAYLCRACLVKALELIDSKDQ